jgi:hypothetical protein
MASSAFGTRTGDVFTWVTIVLTGLFLVLAIVSTAVFRPKEAVLYPQFSPPAGPIESETLVTISSPKTRDELTIRYTTDGTEPTDTSPQYFKDPVRVLPGQTLMARIYRRGKAMPVLSVNYALPQAPRAPTTSTAPAPTSGPERTTSAPSGEPASVPAPVTTSRPAPSPTPASSSPAPATAP